MEQPITSLVSLLEAGKEAEAAEYLAWFVSGARRRGMARIELPDAYLTAVIEERLRGIGCEIRPTLRDGMRSLEIRLVPAPQNPTVP